MADVVQHYIKYIKFRDCVSKTAPPTMHKGVTARFETATPLPSDCSLELMSSGLQSPFFFLLSIGEELISISNEQA